MQYLLTAEEMSGLEQSRNATIKAREHTINQLCTRIANSEPVSVDWIDGGNPRPWGCIHTVKHEHYCDACPVQEHCTQPQEWSK